MSRLAVGQFATRRWPGGLHARVVHLGLLASILTVLLAAGCSGSEAAQEEEAGAILDRPNIIFVLTDDLDFASAQQMPGIGSLLVEEGTSFEKAFVSHPICCPSRATILTGLYDHNHDIRANGPPSGGFEKFVSEGHEEDSIAVSLQDGGYQTAFFGKYLNGYPGDDPTHVPPGWDEWYGKLDRQDLYDYSINENGEEVSYGSEPEDFYTDVLSRQATDFVRRVSLEDQPFFVYVAPTAPHAPATPAERYQNAFVEKEAPRPPSFDEEDVSDKPSRIRDLERISDKEVSNIDARSQKRLRSMLAVDEMIASLVQELEEAGELDNTFIFFTSDNGLQLGEHRIRGGKNQPYEESARVPLFVRGPGVPVGSKTEKLVLNTDLAPTFAELAGVKFPADGRSLTPILRGDEPSVWRSAILLEKLETPQSGEEESGKGKGKKGKGKDKGNAANPPDYQAVRTGTHKYVEYDNDEIELYDLQNDPYELQSLHESADPSLLEDLKAKLDALKSCSEEGCREAEDAP